MLSNSLIYHSSRYLVLLVWQTVLDKIAWPLTWHDMTWLHDMTHGDNRTPEPFTCSPRGQYVTYAYPHKPLKKIKCPSAIIRLTAHFKCRLMSDLVICKHKKEMVIHDTECPPWNQAHEEHKLAHLMIVMIAYNCSKVRKCWILPRDETIRESSNTRGINCKVCWTQWGFQTINRHIYVYLRRVPSTPWTSAQYEKSNQYGITQNTIVWH